MHNHKNTPSKRMAWAFFLNMSFTIIEFIGGWLTNSTAIMADAVHDLGDSLSIGLAWLLGKLSERDSSADFSYGYKRFSLLGALINGMVLTIGSIWVISEAIPKLFNPEMPMIEGMLGLAILGILVNGYAAFKLSSGKTLNERILNWHLLEDVLGWLAVFIVSIVLIFIEWPILDPLLAIGFTLFILLGVLRNMSTTLKLFLQGVPDKELATKVEDILKSIPEVQQFHHLHLWSLDGESHVLTVHINLRPSTSLEKLKSIRQQVSQTLSDLNFSHTTIQFELDKEYCRNVE